MLYTLYLRVSEYVAYFIPIGHHVCVSLGLSAYDSLQGGMIYTCTLRRTHMPMMRYYPQKKVASTYR